MPEYPLLDLATQRPEPGHYVYRLYDAAGLPLYVGSTGNVWERFGQHAGRLRHQWWGNVDFARTIVEYVSAAGCLGKRCPLPDHALMLAREIELIQQLEPKWNRRLGNRCQSGRHLMTPENTYVQPGGTRTCKECRTERWANLPEEKRKWYARNANKWAKVKREGLGGDELRAWDRASKQRAEVKAKAAARKKRPEVRAKLAEQQREYRNRPEVRERLNAQQRERRQRPDLKEWLQGYAQRPEVRARRQEYQGRPEVAARRIELQRERRAQEKLGKEQSPA